MVARSLDFICSKASVWAEEALTEREIEMADAKAAAPLDHLNTAHNIIEEGTIAAGKQRGAEAARAFEEAWKHAWQSA